MQGTWAWSLVRILRAHISAAAAAAKYGQKVKKRKKKRKERKLNSFPKLKHQGLVQAQKLHVNLRTVPVSTALNSPQQPHLLLRCIPWASPAVVTDSNRHQKKEEEKTGTQDKGSSSHVPRGQARLVQTQPATSSVRPQVKSTSVSSSVKWDWRLGIYLPDLFWNLNKRRL